MSKDDNIVLYPNLCKFAQTVEQQKAMENLECCIEYTYTFLKTNKKQDFELAVDFMNHTLREVHALCQNGDIDSEDDHILIDVIHDSLLLTIICS